MINNEHNPIAIRISNIQSLWIENREKHPDSKIYCLVCEPADYQLIEGFIRLEASEHGCTSDIIVGFKTDFDNKTDFYRFLTKEWINSFSIDVEKIPNGIGRTLLHSNQSWHLSIPLVKMTYETYIFVLSQVSRSL